MQQDQLNRGDGELMLPGEQVEPSRRAFLQWTGFGLAGAMATGCSRGPVRAVVPYLQASEEIVPGRSYRIATTCAGCSAACGVVARCRDGRPVKLEGNELHALSRGGLCAVGQAQVLSLYDALRIGVPEENGQPIAWESALTRLSGSSKNGKLRLLTGTITSPSTRSWIRRFVGESGDRAHVVHDALSASAILDAHERTHGVRALPSYQFQAARVIASFDADFLGTWISPVAFAADYAAGRRPDGDSPVLSRHHQFEARMSLTGAAADERTRLAPWEQRAAVAELAAQLESRRDVASRLGEDRPTVDARLGIERLADELWAARGNSLVVCGSNDLTTQLFVNYANSLLDAYGSTLTLAVPSLQKACSDAAVAELCRELEAGEVETLIVSGVNPAFEWPDELGALIRRAGTLVVHSGERNETTAQADLVLPAPHALESWDDAEPVAGRFSLSQPTVQDLRDGRSLRWVLAQVLGEGAGERELLTEHWRAEVFPLVGAAESFEAFFDRALHDGWVESSRGTGTERPFDAAAIPAVTPVEKAEFALVAHASLGMLDGSHAHNPWLQELPDPVTKVTWDNVASLSEARAEALGVEQGDVVRIASPDGARAVELPVFVQRGQHDDVVAVALGYGRSGTDRFKGVGPDWYEGRPTVEEGGTVGSRVEALRPTIAGRPYDEPIAVTISATGRRVQIACTQEHHTLEVPAHLAPKGGEVREAARTASLADFLHDPEHALGAHGEHGKHSDLWPDDHGGALHRWGMSIDLNRCTGCSGCVVACQAENNVPVVGRDEVARQREMQWIRIDRYTQGFGDATSTVHQPMFCQQCDNAPCEAVCPVLATVHSSEGLNQQVYNRCVGTRYCANTCPYKVRRFNWFEYPREAENQNHALNPDVTVRSRGVMEKCSFCAQRIQEAKSEAARTGEPITDGSIRVACQQSCPTQAIVFGDLNDPESEVSKHYRNVRAYGVLEEINVKPSVRYLAKITNTADKENSHAH
ncbi:MAG: 4Fe-4S dicluster domain-containing protein [Planctomycetes bacterium]|nr:4Fe-4S dicluster domain-containing protein [Planctomycetota bacterium]